MKGELELFVFVVMRILELELILIINRMIMDQNNVPSI